MSWSIEEHIGEGRPWPAQVMVYRGETSECLAYVSGEMADRLKAENAKLRAGRDVYRDLVGMMDYPDLNVQLQAENAKLRELVRDYERCNMHADCDRCEYDGTTSTHCPLSPCFPDIDELRELGIEVDQ